MEGKQVGSAPLARATSLLSPGTLLVAPGLRALEETFLHLPRVGEGASQYNALTQQRLPNLFPVSAQHPPTPRRLRPPPAQGILLSGRPRPVRAWRMLAKTPLR